MNWYIIININLFLTKLKTNWILNSRQKNIAIHKESEICWYTQQTYTTLH